MVVLRYRGRNVSEEDILYIRELIAAHPGASRRTLSTKLCEAWQWRQSNGALRDMVCRGLLLLLHRAGRIALPQVAYVRHNPLAARARPAAVLIDTTPIEDRLGDLRPLQFQLVRRTADEPLFNSLMEQHHYLGYEQPVGEHLSIWCGQTGGRLPVWRGRVHRVTLPAETTISAGARKRVAGTSACSPTTRDF